MRKKSRLFVGIDVSKTRLDVGFYPEGSASSAANDEDGIAMLALVLTMRGVERVVLESTGGYGRRVHLALRAAGILSYVVQPLRIRQFAYALGIKAKTDTLDAAVIARYAATATFVERPMPSAALQHVRDLVVRRQQLVDTRVVELTRREDIPDAVRNGSDVLLAKLDELIGDVQAALRAAVRADRELSRREQALRTIKGVGPVVTWTLLALVPELGSCSHKQVAALVGVAPFNDDSGNSHGRRSIRGGRKRVRGALYMAARVAVRYDGPFKAMFERLRAAGRPDKVAITAVMRKLAVVANARVRDAMTVGTVPATAA
jgi:transposase